MKTFWRLGLSLFFIALHCISWGYDITVSVSQKSYSTLSLKYFDLDQQWVTIDSVPFSHQARLKATRDLSPGLYILVGDHTVLTYIIISSSKNQNFTISIVQNKVSFKKSVENEANARYLETMAGYEKKQKEIDNEFRKWQQAEVSQKELKERIDSLVPIAEKLEAEKRKFQDQIIKKNHSTLLASIVAASKEMPPPPTQYFQDKNLIEEYYLQHFFDDFPWQDSRLLNTPIALNKFRQFINVLSRISQEHAALFLEKTLKSASVSPETYTYLTSLLTDYLGDQDGRLWNESLYILMLKDIIEHDFIDRALVLRAQKELKRLDINQPGKQVPNVHILLSSGDTTTLYDVNTDYLLLYLQNPDCPSCIEIRERMKGMDVLNKAIVNKKIIVLTLYFEQNESLWRKYLAESANPLYMHGWDYRQQIESEILFDTHVIPYIFILDRNKNVIKKDLPWSEIEHWLENMNNEK